MSFQNKINLSFSKATPDLDGAQGWGPAQLEVETNFELLEVNQIAIFSDSDEPTGPTVFKEFVPKELWEKVSKKAKEFNLKIFDLKDENKRLKARVKLLESINNLFS